MPRLDNPKHERFAQDLAKGVGQAEAYVNAGYSFSEPNASRLTSNEKIRARVSELLERGAIRAEITVANITERLLRIAEKGESADGAAMLAVGRAALMDVAKLHGMVVEKNLNALTTVEDLLDQLDGKAG